MQKKVVTIGGGGAHAWLVKAICDLPIAITAIVNTVDEGGSTGALMRAYGVSSMGDARNVLAAFASDDDARVLQHRFADGFLEGHTVGNIVLAGMERAGMSLPDALARLGNWMHVSHRVVPMTTTSPTLVAETISGKTINGQAAIVRHIRGTENDPYTRVWLAPSTMPLASDAESALRDADIVIVAMGDLYSSVAPFFCLDAVRALLPSLRAQMVWMTNAVAPIGHTHYRTLGDALAFFQSCAPTFMPNVIVAHDGTFSAKEKVRLDERGYLPVAPTGVPTSARLIASDQLDHEWEPPHRPGDRIDRSPVARKSAFLRETIASLL